MEDIQFNKIGFYLLGAGGLGRELESWYDDSLFSNEYRLKGFVDDNNDALVDINNDYSILDSFKGGQIWKGNSILIGVSSCEFKKNAYFILKENNCKILAFKHDTSIVGKNSKLGIGYVLCPYVIVSCNVKLGNLVTINIGSQIGHDVVIGDYTSIMANVDIGGGALIGDNVFIGSNAVILPGVKIPDNTRIGAGSVVLKSIKQVGTYFGNPAKKIF